MKKRELVKLGLEKKVNFWHLLFLKFDGKLAADIHTRLIIQALQDGCVLTFHSSQPPCLCVYPSKFPSLAFAPVSFRYPGLRRTKDPPWGLQQGSKVVTGAVPPSFLPFSPLNYHFGHSELWRELRKLCMSGLWVPHGERVDSWIRPWLCLGRPGLRPGCCPSFMVERGGLEASLFPETTQHPPNRGPAQQGVQPVPRGGPGSQVNLSTTLPHILFTYCRGLGAFRFPLKLPSLSALHGGPLTAYRKSKPMEAISTADEPAALPQWEPCCPWLQVKGSTANLGQQSQAGWRLCGCRLTTLWTYWKACLSVKVMWSPVEQNTCSKGKLMAEVMPIAELLLLFLIYIMTGEWYQTNH